MLLLCIGYPIIGLWMLFAKHWPVRAGLSTLTIALLPVAWLFTLPSDEVGAPGTGIFMMLLAVPIGISLLLIAAGVLMATFKFARRLRSQ
jgi:hypothetical protein